MGAKHGTLAERLWRRVLKTETCWLWQGATSRSGHGTIGEGMQFGHVLTTHRVSWELHNGPIPEGMQVLHKCDVPNCVNPAHLWLGTAADNQRDKIAKGRGRAQVTAEEKQMIIESVAKIGIKPTAAAFGRSKATIRAIIRGGWDKVSH